MSNVLSLVPGGKTFRTRFAPSPTGLLHLGHVASAIAVWGLAEHLGAEVLLRIEDHDRQRCRPEFTEALLADLSFLGFYGEGQPLSVQSHHPDRYGAALEQLRTQGRIYACACSRKELALRSGLKEAKGELKYDGYCRDKDLPWEQLPLRFRVEPEAIDFEDLELGWQVQVPADQCGDFLLRDKEGHWTYNFCVVVDDCQEHIDLVIRGMDLLSSTGRQIHLAQALGSKGPRLFLHHPLILESNGEKLSKRYGSTSLQTLIKQGCTREDLLGLAAFAIGLQDDQKALRRQDLGRLWANRRLFLGDKMNE